MAQALSNKDFEWSHEDEPHAIRKKEILAKYPEIKKLMGPCPRTKYVVMATVGIQVAMCYSLKDAEVELHARLTL
jgi:sphingolipid delta-4 desaturase